MDADKIKKKQSLKVIISESIMVLAVVVTVAALALVVSGYWVNSDFKVERNGMLQIASMPTGADVTIDGETSSWLQRTNTSKVLSSGEHNVVLSKDGYDSWSKTINISEGLLYRIHYPRLFLKDRTPETVLSTVGTTFATISPDNEKLLLIGNTTEWSFINLNNDDLKPKKLDVSDYFSDASVAEGASVGVFAGSIVSADWDRSSTHVLLQTVSNGVTEWVLIDTDNIKNSINLSKEFGANFSSVKILDNSASSLLAIQNGNLHKIDVPGRLVSSVLVENIYDFDHYENEIIYSARSGTANSGYNVGLIKIGNDDISILETTSEPTKVGISKFYDEMYIETLIGSQFTLYKKDDFSKISDFQLTFNPSTMKVGHNGEFITMHHDSQIATLDMETNSVREWSVEGANFDWLDNDMIYTVSDGELVVYDFDGLNRRELAKNVSNHFPVSITANKWLYYFSDDNLTRELIAR